MTKFTRLTHLRIIMGAQVFWLVMVCLLGAWWGRLVLSQAGRIAELEGFLGISTDLTQNHWHRTQRMLYWESFTFFALLLTSTALLFWLYWRDLKRTRSLQAFFAGVTHELRTPLTSIRLQAESIAESLAADDSQKNLIQRLLEDSVRLEAQVERTLELARMEGGGPVFSQPVQVKPWLDRFLKSWKSDYRAKVEIMTQVEDHLIEADPAAMQVIFKNLLENSVKHSGREMVQIQINSRMDQDGVFLVLKDNGNGYWGDLHHLGKLFQKGPHSSGTGVGLYLVKMLMRRMGGRLKLRGQSGFEAELWFPGAREEVEAYGRAAPFAAPRS